MIDLGAKTGRFWRRTPAERQPDKVVRCAAEQIGKASIVELVRCPIRCQNAGEEERLLFGALGGAR